MKRMKSKVGLTLIRQILEQYRLKPQQIHSPQKGYRNTILPVTISSLNSNLEQPNANQVAIIFFKNEPSILRRIKNANQVSQALANKYFPTRQLITPPNLPCQKILKLSLGNNKQSKFRYIGLYNYLPGKTIEWEAYTQKHLKLLGQVFSQTHHQLKKLEQTQDLNPSQLPDQIKDLSQLNELMASCFKRKNVQIALEEKLGLKTNQHIFDFGRELIDELKKLGSRQILHMDFVRSNILFEKIAYSQLEQRRLTAFALDPNSNLDHKSDSKNNQCNQTFLTVSGILDWEKTSYGPKIIDLARTLSFLLVDCKYKSNQKIRKYFLHSGYRKRGSANLPNLKLLNPLINFFLLFDFYKFLLHNPYQDLIQNEHFTRTKETLLRNKLLQRV